MIPDNTLVITQNLSHFINFYNLEGEFLDKQNFKGRYIVQNQSELGTVSEITNLEEFNRLVIENYHYSPLYNLNNEGLIFRYYYPAAKDTSSNQSIQLRTCGYESEKIKQQRIIIKNTPKYLQILDANSKKCLFDDAYTLKGKFILNNNTTANTFFTYTHENNTFKFYKYQILY